jgi:hypothetical protein
LKPFALLAGKENGIDLEGLAVDGTTLFAGFRGPVLRHGLTPVWRFTFEDPGAGTLLLVTLDGRGIRDLVKVSDGFLVLAGPVGDADTLHRVYWWNGSDCVPGRGNAGGSLRLLGEIVPPAPNGKAEVLLIRNEGAKAYDVLVAFDSLPKGGISRYSIPRRASLHSPGTRLCGAGG